MKLAGNLLVLAIAVTLVLLAVESSTVLQFFGYLWGVLLFIAVVLNWTGATKR